MDLIIEHGAHKLYSQCLIVSEELKYGEYFDKTHQEWVIDEIQLNKWFFDGHKIQAWWTMGTFRGYEGDLFDIEAVLKFVSVTKGRRAMAKL